MFPRARRRRASKLALLTTETWHPHPPNVVRPYLCIPSRLRLLPLATIALLGCTRNETPPEPAPPPKTVIVPPAPVLPTVDWTDPPKWQRVPGGSPMRKAHYKIRASAGDSEGAEATVYYFGQNSGGSVDANIQRWISQFPDTPPDAVKRSTRDAHGLKQTIVDIQGTYENASMGMKEDEPKKPNFRMIAAVVETPAGSYFFKLTGPEKSVEAARATYFTLLDSVVIHQG